MSKRDCTRKWVNSTHSTASRIVTFNVLSCSLSSYHRRTQRWRCWCMEKNSKCAWVMGVSLPCSWHLLQALLLPGYPFNHGALLAAAHLLSGSDPALHIAVGRQLHTHTSHQSMLLFTIAQFFSFSLLSWQILWQQPMENKGELSCMYVCVQSYRLVVIRQSITMWKHWSTVTKQ